MGLASVLDAAVRATDQPRRGPLASDRPVERFERGPGRASRPAHRPAHDLARVRGARIAARNSQPSPVRTRLRSASQTGLGRAASKFRPSRLGATGCPCRLSVVRTRSRQGGQPAQARAPLSGRATRWRPTRRPCPRKTAWTRGAPWAPPLAGRGPGGCPRAAPGWPGSSRSRAETAKRGTRSPTPPRPRPSPERARRPCARRRTRTSSGGRVPQMSAAFRKACRAPSRAVHPRTSAARSRPRGRPGTSPAAPPPSPARRTPGPAPQHRLVHPPPLGHRDDAHPARAHPIHRLALGTPRRTPAAVVPRPSPTPLQVRSPISKRPPMRARSVPAGRGASRPGDGAPRGRYLGPADGRKRTTTHGTIQPGARARRPAARRARMAARRHGP